MIKNVARYCPNNGIIVIQTSRSRNVEVEECKQDILNESIVKSLMGSNEGI